MSDPQNYISNSPQQTIEIAQQIGATITPGSCVCLYGDLGAGKTTFTQGFARGLHITDRVISPTFSLMRQYKSDNPMLSFLYHIDLYRLDSLEEIQSIGIDDAFADSKGVCLIEWADRLGEKLPKNRIDITISGEDSFREIALVRHSNS